MMHLHIFHFFQILQYCGWKRGRSKVSKDADAFPFSILSLSCCVTLDLLVYMYVDIAETNPTGLPWRSTYINVYPLWSLHILCSTCIRSIICTYVLDYMTKLVSSRQYKYTYSFMYSLLTNFQVSRKLCAVWYLCGHLQ